MHLQFDANQEYQIAAIEAVADLFDGQPRVDAAMDFSLSAGFAAVANRLELSEDALLQNLAGVQQANGIPPEEALQWIADEITTADGTEQVQFANFSVEMETGTGKTYVYIRTALELFQRYGFRKFIIVVPSVAIREGVLKTFQITRSHLTGLYDNLPYRFTVYDSSNLSQVRQFALSDSVEFMIMTIDSFNKASNVIRQSTDHLQGETPIHLLQATRPVLVLDEPQNMESELRIKALANLNPLFALRYSATHRNPYNLVHRLTPYEAYRQGLVKQIEVAGIEERNENQAFLRLDGFKTTANTVAARLAVHKLMKDGTVKEKVVTVKPGDSLADKANRSEYGEFMVEEIDAGLCVVRFSNRMELSKGETHGPDKEAIFREQIRYTVERHFRKQKQLAPHGIKVLSLFFIDRVSNYRNENGEDGLIRGLFDETFNEAKAYYPEWQSKAPGDVQAAYFAQKRKRGGDTILEDSTTGEAKKDIEAYDLIMRDKERLLSFDESTCFIFSHSALREGWDNPNVFQICTLNQSVSEMRKRQEIGRGVRLAVNQDGLRVREDGINILTVVANESYQKYCDRYQTELADEVDGASLPPKPSNARKKITARLRKQYMLKPAFKELWERIKHKTRYAVKIDTEKLIEDVLDVLDQTDIRAPEIAVSTARMQVDGRKDELRAIKIGEKRGAWPNSSTKAQTNIVELMNDLMQRTTPPMRLTRRTLLEIFRRTRNRNEAARNPHEFAATAVQIIKQKLTDQLIDGIQYERIHDWYRMEQFENEIESWEEYAVPADRSLYDHVISDSDIEKQFVQDMERRDDVKLYIKLPGWFTVQTPIGQYNPDWAVVIEPRDEFGNPTEEEMLYLVSETKGTGNLDKLRPDEQRRIHCGKRHFENTLHIPYRVVANAGQLHG
ncbi:MAG: DEAD/DEAH box helicase family protein [Candidatus Pacebacteria bacterium]|nr:DEAD/DEAH box helicase family protein [Candidatus Paceibacterota bacterium]